MSQLKVILVTSGNLWRNFGETLERIEERGGYCLKSACRLRIKILQQTQARPTTCDYWSTIDRTTSSAPYPIYPPQGYVFILVRLLRLCTPGGSLPIDFSRSTARLFNLLAFDLISINQSISDLIHVVGFDPQLLHHVRP